MTCRPIVRLSYREENRCRTVQLGPAWDPQTGNYHDPDDELVTISADGINGHRAGEITVTIAELEELARAVKLMRGPGEAT